MKESEEPTQTDVPSISSVTNLPAEIPSAQSAHAVPRFIPYYNEVPGCHLDAA